MNICSFTGYLTEDPFIKKNNGVSQAEFTIVVHTYRTAKSTGEKSRLSTFLDCEAWHTGAETIASLAEEGTQITVNATAKNVKDDEELIIFRINEFDLPCLDHD